MKYIFTISFTFLVFLNFFSQKTTSQQNEIRKIDEVFRHVFNSYVDDVNAKELAETAIVSALEKLDPHSAFIPKEEVDDANQMINGNFVGVGIRFQILKDTLIVVATIPGGPSEKVGLQAGDKIIQVNNEIIANVKLKNSQVREKLMGELGSKVSVIVLRKNEKNKLQFTITRGKIPLHSVDCHYMLTPEVGYIKLNSFSQTTTDEIKTSLENLVKQGMKSLILDLQDNGGGLMYAAKTVSDEFLEDGKLIVYSEGKNQPRQDLLSDTRGTWEKGKLVILVNENSASASEIVSGAIQDWDRGLIVGRRTYGKGLVQRPINLLDGSQLRLTIAKYYTPSGRNIQKPYNGNIKDYQSDVIERYKHGELSNQDSIKFPDSLIYQTRNKKRIVYGGGGIMPDIFVPIDTSDYTTYFRKVLGSGLFNSFALTFVNQHRDSLLHEYSTFNEFRTKFNCDEKFMTNFLKYIQTENPEIEMMEEDFKKSISFFQLFLKSLVAQDLWGSNEFYQIYNERNTILRAALDTLNGKTYTKFGLTK